MEKDRGRKPGSNRSYRMDFIPDKTLFYAVSFALKKMRQGTPLAIANSRAADYYGVTVQDVAHYTGQVGGRSPKRKRHR